MATERLGHVCCHDRRGRGQMCCHGSIEGRGHACCRVEGAWSVNFSPQEGRGHTRCHGSGGGTERLAPPAGGAAQARLVRAVPARSRSRSSGAGEVERRRPRPSGECGGTARWAREGAGSVTDITRIPAPAATARQHRPGGPRGLRGWSGGAGPGTGLEKRGQRGEGPPEMERPEVRGGPVRPVPPGME